jgi:hypothetical protein
MARRHEIAVRMALGATSQRIVRQILTESCLIAAFGGICGTLLALWATKALQSLAPPHLIPLRGTDVDARVLAFTAAVSLFTGLLFGVVPALQASRNSPRSSLQEGRTVAGSPRQNRTRDSFAIAQVALALVLLTGAGLLIRSFSRLVNVDPGFQSDNILTAQIQLPNTKYKDDTRRSQFFAELLTKVRQLPRVRSASANAFLPFSGIIAGTGAEVVGRPSLPISQQPVVDVAVVEPQFFETMQIPLLAGRTLPSVRQPRFLTRSSSVRRWRASCGPTKIPWADKLSFT